MAPSVQAVQGKPSEDANLISQSGVKQNFALDSVKRPRFDSLEEEERFRKLHLAVAFRWMGAQGYDDASVAGHISARSALKPDHFWINPFAKSFKMMKVSDLVLVNEDGVVCEGGNIHAINAAGFAIHSAIHKARPDVIAAVHAHSTAGKAYSALGLPLDYITQDACRFYNDHAVYNNFGGVVLDREEGKRIAKALGDNSAVLLQNHGILTVGKTVDAAAFLFGAMERCCQVQMMADMAAKARGVETVKIGDEEAAYTHRIQTDELRYVSFQPS